MGIHFPELLDSRHDSAETALAVPTTTHLTCESVSNNKHESTKAVSSDTRTLLNAQVDGSGQKPKESFHAGGSEITADQEALPTVEASTQSTEPAPEPVTSSKSSASLECTTPLESATSLEPAPEAKKPKREHTRDPVAHDLSMDDPKWLEEELAIQSILQYNFKDRLWLREAMYTHKAHDGRLENGMLLEGANWALAQHGDSVLRYTLLDCCFDEMESSKTRMTVGKMQNRLSELISDKHLHVACGERGITALMMKWYPRAVLAKPGKKGYSTTVEALIGAVDRDSGGDKNAVRKVLSILLEIDLVEAQDQASPSRAKGHPLSANEQAQRLAIQLDQGERIDSSTLFILAGSLVAQAGRRIGKAFGMFGCVIMALWFLWCWWMLIF